MHDVVAACRERTERSNSMYSGRYFLFCIAISDSWFFFFCFRLMVFCGGNIGLSALNQ